MRRRRAAGLAAVSAGVDSGRGRGRGAGGASGRWLARGPDRTAAEPVGRPAPPPPTPDAAALHATLFIADLHADTLLWGRDLLVRGDRGHSDVPRMVEGNVALQVLAVTTKSPRHLNLDRNDDGSDDVTLVAMASGWPVRTWRSLRERALHQAARAHAFAARSEGRLRLIESREDLEAFRAARAADPTLCAAMLAIEGAQCLEGDCANVEVFAASGYRMISPAPLLRYGDRRVGARRRQGWPDGPRPGVGRAL